MSIFTKINEGTADFQTKTTRNRKFSLNYDELGVALCNKMYRHENINLLIYAVYFPQIAQVTPKLVLLAQKSVFMAQNEDQMSKSPTEYGITLKQI